MSCPPHPTSASPSTCRRSCVPASSLRPVHPHPELTYFACSPSFSPTLDGIHLLSSSCHLVRDWLLLDQGSCEASSGRSDKVKGNQLGRRSVNSLPGSSCPPIVRLSGSTDVHLIFSRSSHPHGGPLPDRHHPDDRRPQAARSHAGQPHSQGTRQPALVVHVRRNHDDGILHGRRRNRLR